jgi:putative restriction endonuclease
VDLGVEQSVRAAAFAWMDELVRRHGSFVPQAPLAAGFEFDGRRVPLWSQRGIWRPAFLSAALVIKTDHKNPYGDEFDGDFLRYRYQGTDPGAWDNRALRAAYEAQLPLIYLRGEAAALYAPVYPAFVQHDDPAELTVSVAFEPADLTIGGSVVAIDRAYATRAAVQRLHQQRFRRVVLRAYQDTCSVCRLRIPRLLDAAHIIDDRSGPAEVPNGLALCKIHHAAFDADLIGIQPRGLVEVQQKVLRERDGPMLRHGLQEVHGQRLHVPQRTADHPRAEYLEQRYERFRQAS